MSVSSPKIDIRSLDAVTHAREGNSELSLERKRRKRRDRFPRTVRYVLSSLTGRVPQRGPFLWWLRIQGNTMSCMTLN